MGTPKKTNRPQIPTPAQKFEETSDNASMMLMAKAEVIAGNASDTEIAMQAIRGENAAWDSAQADKPIAVFAGHSCGNVPNGQYGYCDHVEEQMLPLKAWGTNAVLARHQARTYCTEQQDLVVWRIIAGTDDMHVTFVYPYAERERAWNLVTTLNRMGTPVRDSSDYPDDRWVLSRHQKDQLRKHLHSLDWPDLTWAFTESNRA